MSVYLKIYLPVWPRTADNDGVCYMQPDQLPHFTHAQKKALSEPEPAASNAHVKSTIRRYTTLHELLLPAPWVSCATMVHVSLATCKNLRPYTFSSDIWAMGCILYEHGAPGLKRCLSSATLLVHMLALEPGSSRRGAIVAHFPFALFSTICINL